MKHSVTTIVLERSGRLHLALKDITVEDAQRWADEGYQVFVIAANDKMWAVNHVNSGGMLYSDRSKEMPDILIPTKLLEGES